VGHPGPAPRRGVPVLTLLRGATSTRPPYGGAMIAPVMQEAVAAELSTFFDSRRASTARVDPLFCSAVTELERFVLRGGKRVRPSFAWWGWRGAGGDPDGADAPAVLRACAALELIQACALVHDDLMDASATRRGHPTVHVAFARHHQEQGWRGDSDRFGLAASVLLGDLALAWADDMLRGAGLAVGALQRCAPVWEAMRTEVLGGQYLDVLTEVRGDESPEAALRTARFKTAAYTVERPLHLGAALAGAPEELVAAYRAFGTDVGVAFQLRDDLLGVFGDPAVTGKPAGDDLREGKRTLLLSFALQAADEKDAAAGVALRAGLGRDLEPGEVDELREHLVRLGAVTAVEHRIAELTQRGLATLDASTVEPAAREHLHAMARAATERTS
jgi:geranylgeranyl diphosphate synthase type I